MIVWCIISLLPVCPRAAPEEELVTEKLEPFDPKANRCYFNGKNYELNSRLTTENKCIKCDCKLPPYFTCSVTNDCQ